MKESEIQRYFRLSAAHWPRAVLWRNNAGVATHYKGGRTCPNCHEPTLGAQKFHTKYGLQTGASDLIGLVDGRFCAIETKTKRGKLTTEQRLFIELVASKGGFGAVVRSDSAADVLSAILKGDSTHGL